MMNDVIIYELLQNFISKILKNADNDLQIEAMAKNPRYIWQLFYDESKTLEDDYSEIEFLIRNIFKEIRRKEKVKCKFCRVDEGFSVAPPVVPHELCKKHRQEYEESFVDRTLHQAIIPKAIKFQENRYGRT